MQRKCCAHCPGSVTRTGEPIREHVCNVPEYVSGRLRIPPASNNKNNQRNRANSAKTNDSPKQASCYERFAIAKKFHAENLQHQPLPDRVDDAIFTIDKPADDPCMCETVKRCQKLVPRRQELNRKKERSRGYKYAPILGCKKPTTWMDLAICWETPVDPNYEPPRAVHIDGSGGGPAPAIFTLVQHAESQIDCRDGCIPNQDQEDSDDSEERQKGTSRRRHDMDDDKEELCKNLTAIRISPGDKATGEAARCKRAQFMRHCCGESRQRPKSQRAAVRSASCLQKIGCSVVNRKNNGLAQSKSHVPRPRTPYARRSFCIDSLAPPFSIVEGCRDADYPEHWRLTSIYQQSYRNPRKMREGRTLLNYHRPQ